MTGGETAAMGINALWVVMFARVVVAWLTPRRN